MALVLCEARGMRATPLERESAGPQSHHLQAPEWWLEVGEYLVILDGVSLVHRLMQPEYLQRFWLQILTRAQWE